MKKTLILFLILNLTACAELGQVLEDVTGSQVLTEQQIALGLKEALNNGITNEVTDLTLTDGFYKNELVKILYPQELQKVDKTLRDIGLGALADEGLKMLNRAAEDAVGEAIPIFKEAILSMTFEDARQILMGDQNAATVYLQNTTTAALRAKFDPIIRNSFQKVGADKVWADVINTYNQIPLVRKVNPDIAGYTTDEALKGVFNMVAVEELKIRTDIKARTSELLRRVFALQDNQ